MSWKITSQEHAVHIQFNGCIIRSGVFEFFLHAVAHLAVTAASRVQRHAEFGAIDEDQTERAKPRVWARVFLMYSRVR